MVLVLPRFSTILSNLLMPGLLPLIEHWFVLIASCIALISQLHLLFITSKKPLKGRLSTNLIINILCWCFTCVCGIAHGGYMTLLWRQDVNIYSGYGIFWTGTAFYTSTALVSISVTFLMLDRIFALIWPALSNKHREVFNSIALTTILSGGLFVIISLAILELPIENVTACATWGCVLVRHKGLTCIGTKLFTGFTNFIVALVFAAFIFRHSSTSLFSQKNFKRTNFLALFAALTEFLLNLSPNAFFVFNSIIDFPQWEVFGPYLTVCAATDGLISACMYRWLITRNANKDHNNKSTTQPVSNRQASRVFTTSVATSNGMIGQRNGAILL